MKTFSYELPEPIEYSHQGEPVEGSEIIFNAPKANQRKESAKLKQMFFRSLPKHKPEVAENEKDDDMEITGGDVLFMISSSLDVDYVDFIETGRKILCGDNAKIEGQKGLTSALLDKIDVDVVEQMIGEYVANFIVKSALDAQSKK